MTVDLREMEQLTSKSVEKYNWTSVPLINGCVAAVDA